MFQEILSLKIVSLTSALRRTLVLDTYLFKNPRFMWRCSLNKHFFYFGPWVFSLSMYFSKDFGPWKLFLEKSKFPSSSFIENFFFKNPSFKGFCYMRTCFLKIRVSGTYQNIFSKKICLGHLVLGKLYLKIQISRAFGAWEFFF